jgi:UDP-2,3-diacylglucosamine pyrophosphatase LpxH
MQAAALTDFLQHHEAENLFLVGDIIDGWISGADWHWSDEQEAAAAAIRSWVQCGRRVTLMPGNHDLCPEAGRRLLGLDYGPLELIYTTLDGRRMLVTHGHQFDRKLAAGKWWQGPTAYAMALRISQWYDRDWTQCVIASRKLGSFLRYRVKRAVEYFMDFDDRAIFAAVNSHTAHGIICGHIHRAEQRLIGPIWYINDGDWVDSRTALVEGWDGALRLLRWDCPPADVTTALASDGGRLDGNGDERPALGSAS